MLMSVPQALFLGIIQGLTEFLPISSSGHLVILQHFMGIKEPVVFFDVLLHVGTLGAVLVFFRKEIYLMLLSLIKFNLKDKSLRYRRKLALMVVTGTLPTLIIGLILQKWENFIFGGEVIPAIMLLFTGGFLWLAEKLSPNPGIKEQIGLLDALLVGAMQGVAILPGVSRSGVTISTGLMRGVRRELSFRYSFFLFIPATIGAFVLESKDLNFSKYQISTIVPFIFGTFVAFFVGMLALKILQNVLKEKKLTIFSWYCWALGGGVLIFKLVSYA